MTPAQAGHNSLFDGNGLASTRLMVSASRSNSSLLLEPSEEKMLSTLRVGFFYVPTQWNSVRTSYVTPKSDQTIAEEILSPHKSLFEKAK